MTCWPWLGYVNFRTYFILVPIHIPTFYSCYTWAKAVKLSYFCIFWTLWRAVVAIAAWCLVHQKMHYGRVKSRASLNSFIFIQSLLMVFALHSRSFPKRVTEAFEWLNLTAPAWFHHIPPLLCTPHMNTVYPMMINWACWAGTNMYERHHSCIGLTGKTTMTNDRRRQQIQTKDVQQVRLFVCI